MKWGSFGSGQGQFNQPFDIARDAVGNLYVTDISNDRVQKFDSNGNYLTQRGSSGAGNGQFSKPHGIIVDGGGNVNVVDHWNDRIQKFDSSGNYLSQWGSPGSGDGQLAHPVGIAIDGSGNFYIADHNNHRIQKFDPSGNFITKWGSFGSGDGQFNEPKEIAIDSYGNVYVTDGRNHRVQKFDLNGTFISKWGTYGTGDGQFDFPHGIEIDSSDNVFVADSNNNRVQKFDLNGTFITKWGSYGTGDGQFNFPQGIEIDSLEDVYIADRDNHRIQKFTAANDTNPPRTTLETSPTTPNGPNGWFETTPTITLSRDEPGTTYYQWDSTSTGGWTAGTNPAALAGVHTLYYYSVDNANNTETIRSQAVKVDTSPWQQVSPTGFGNPNNIFLQINYQGSYKGELYAGSLNEASGGRIWKTSDGLNWTTTTVGGFGGDPDNKGTGPGGNYFGYLYGWAENGTDPVSLWRSTDGANWTAVPVGLTPLSGGGGAWAGILFKGNVYAGTWGISGGGEILRSADGLSWTTATPSPGFGDPTKPGADPKDVWKGYLYGANGGPPGNSSLFRTVNGTDWSTVTINGDPANTWYLNGVTGFNGYLYVSKGDGWIWRTADLSTWTTATARGFGDPNNSVGGFRKINGRLYTNTGNGVTGSQVWRTANGTDWENITPAWDAGNTRSRHITPYKGRLYMVTRNDQKGGEIWSLPFNNTPSGNNVSPDLGGAATLTFSQVTTPGSTAVWTENWIGPANPPAGYSFLETYYDFSTDAGHTGPTTITVPYDPSEVTGSESNLKLLHFDETAQSWENVTTGVDTVDNKVTGVTGSLSVFVLGELNDTTPPITSFETSPTAPNGPNGWFEDTPTITLNRSEPGTTYYQWDSTSTGGWIAGTNPSAQAGIHTLYYYSVDTADNSEAVKNQEIKVDTSPWQQVAPSGFGDPNNAMLHLNFQGSYKGDLYAGSLNQVSGGRIWRTSDGLNWTTTTVGGFGGDPDNQVTGPGGNYFGYLYGVAENGTDPVSLWRSTNGADWTPIPLGLAPDPWWAGAWAGILFKGNIYAGTWGISGGGEILKSSDGLNWTTSTPQPGFGDPTKHGAEPKDIWKGYLYGINGDGGPGGQTKLFRTANGTDWAEVVINGEATNTQGVNGLTGFNGYLYVSNNDGWIWRTADLSTWTTVTAEGFGNPNNSVGGFRKINGRLYTNTGNGATASQIWRTANGTDWENITPAWDGGNIRSRHITPYKGRIYLVTRNNQKGGEIWSMPFNNTPAGSNVSPDLGGAAALTFSQVTTSGSTAVWTENWIGPANPPAGYSFLETYYDFSTDAGYTGQITLTIPYDQSLVTGSENNLKLLHWNETGQSWADVTTGVDTANNKVTGVTGSLSVFAVGETSDSVAPSVPQVTGFEASSTAVGLYWPASNDNVGVTGYAVYNADSDSLIGTTTASSYIHGGLTPGNTYRYYVKSFDAAGNYSAGSSVVTINLSAGGLAPAGSGVETVTVSPSINLSLAFTDITTDGTVTVSESNSPSYDPPSGFSFNGKQYDITTTAGFVPPITVAFKYNEADVGNEADLKLFHWENGQWVDITLYVDTDNNIIVGQANSLSPFVLGEPEPPATGLNTGGLLGLALAMLIAGAALIRQRRNFALG